MKRFLFNLKYRCLKRDTISCYRVLSKSQYWELSEWRQHHACKKRELVRHAVQTIPFYRKFYGGAGFELGDAWKDGWFERLPILTKEHIRAHFEDMTDKNLLKWTHIATTGGSTGVPLKVRYDGRLPYEVYTWRLLDWWGCGPWDDGGYVWRNPRNARQQFFNNLLWWPTRKVKLDASIMTEASMDEFIQKFNRLRPPVLQGYVGAIDELATFVFRTQKKMFPPKMIWLTSAPISPVQRKRVENAFGAPVCDQYGSCEIPSIAAQCPVRKGLHVNSEHIYIEFVDDSNAPVDSTEWGKTLLTNYGEFSFPLIRYENGDRGRWLNEVCSCGRTLPLMDSVKGRVSEMIYLPSGRMINGEYLTTIFDEFPDAVSGFRVVQKKDLSLIVEYVSAIDVGLDFVLKRVRDTLESRIRGEVPLELHAVQKIEHDRGKMRFIIRE